MTTHIIFKSVATLPDHSGMYRVSYTAGSDFLYEGNGPKYWSDKNAAEQVSHMNNKACYERVDEQRWQLAKEGKLSGYAKTSDINAPVIVMPWIPFS